MLGTILLVGKDLPQLDPLLSQLHENYFQTEVVGYDQAFQHQVKSLKPDAILIHHGADRINAFNLCRQLKRDPSLVHTPILILVSSNDQLDWGAAMTSLADDIYALTADKCRMILGRLKFLMRDYQSIQNLQKQVGTHSISQLAEVTMGFSHRLRLLPLGKDLRQKYPDKGQEFKWIKPVNGSDGTDAVFVPIGLTQELDLLRLKSEPDFDGVPIICETDAKSWKASRHLFELGADDVFFANFGTEKLSLQLQSLVARKGQKRQLRHQIKEHLKLANIDALTGILNRRAGLQRAEHAIRKAFSIGSPLCAIMLDIDHFKTLNDTHGHPLGDQVLRTVAQRVQTGLREIDILCRYGGEEFLVILPNTSPKSAAKIAARLRHEVGQPMSLLPDLDPIRLSAGIAPLSQTHANLGALIEQADQALYAAKKAGRDQQVVYAPTIANTKAI